MYQFSGKTENFEFFATNLPKNGFRARIVLLEVAKGDVFIQEYNNVMAIYGSDFYENRFQVQLETLKEYCTNLDGNAYIRFVTDTLQNLKVQNHLNEVFKLILVRKREHWVYWSQVIYDRKWNKVG